MQIRVWVTAGGLALGSFGCQGDPVGSAPTADVSTDGADTSSALDALTPDGDGAGDVVDSDGALPDCLTAPENLLPNGDFAGGLSGWSPSDVTTSFSTGPCGAALHMVTTGAYGGISYQTKRTFPVGTKLRVRGWFKSTSAPIGDPPAVFATLFHAGDGGDVTDSEVWTAVKLESGWTLSEAFLTTKHEETSFTFVVASRRTTGGDDFFVSGLALRVEK